MNLIGLDLILKIILLKILLKILKSKYWNFSSSEEEK